MNRRDIDIFVDQQTSHHTRRAYRSDLTRWVAFLDGRHPTPEDVVRFKKGLELALSSASAARVFATCRTFYRWLGGDNPFDRVKAPQRVKNQSPKTPSNEAVDRTLAAVDTSTLQGKRDAAILALLTNGLRAQEVADLMRDALEFVPEFGAWVIRVVGKGSKERTVPALPEVVEKVRVFQTEAQKVSHWLLYDHTGYQLTMRQVEEAVYRAARRAGVEGMHPHALRHHYATRLARAGINVFHLQKLLGHARADTTQMYVGLELADLVEASRLDPRAQPEEPRLRVVGAA